MSYYILPKKNIEFTFDVKTENQEFLLQPFVTNSLFFYLNDIHLQIQKIKDSEKGKESQLENSYDFLLKIMNPYEFIFSKVPNTKISVSKLKPFSNTFYIFMEIIQMFNLIDLFENINIRTMHYGPNTHSIIDCLDMMREDMNDMNIHCHTIKDYEYNEEIKSTVAFLTYELEKEYNCSSAYIHSLLFILYHLLFTQSVNGIAIIKIDNIFYKPIVEFTYILTSLYEKVYIIKPNICSIYSSERFIVCKNFILNPQKEHVYNRYLSTLNNILLLKPDEYVITSLLKNELPYYFVNKIDESNIIIGHQQLEFMNQVITFYKNKNKEEKVELMKKNNIQKCIQWCEKLKIPYNKFNNLFSLSKINLVSNGQCFSRILAEII